MLSFITKESLKVDMKLDKKNELELSTLIGNVNLIDYRIDPKRSNKKKPIKREKEK